MDFLLEEYKVQGIKLNYYFICKRKLWLFSKGIAMENTSDRVLQGKTIHENSYVRDKNKEILIDDTVCLDIMDKEYVKEVKISSKMEYSDKMQLLYYLFYLKNLGINRKGKINYVKEKKVEEVELTEEYEEIIKNALIDIKEILRSASVPKVIKAAFCKKCAYYEFCYAGEEE